MKPLEELDHYEILELPRGAESDEIEVAYRTLRATYAPDSLAIYSMLDASDAEFVRGRIESAYRILSDSTERHRYDLHLAGEPPDDEPPIREDHAVARGEAYPDGKIAAERTEMPAADGGVNAQAPSQALGRNDSGFDGAGLRQARLRHGFEFDQLADITKISPNYLRCIEQERFDELPAPVYVRGFVEAFARALGLDAADVVSRYMARLEAERSGPKRSRLLGRN